MNIVYPQVRANLLPSMLGYALLGALVAGSYGVLHDELTYSISAEYFTRMKFLQFHYADFGFPPRIFVAEIGFLATWWVGLLAGWFLARTAFPTFSRSEARAHLFRGFAIILACALTGSFLGFSWGLLRGPDGDFSAWRGFVTARGVVDLPSFVRVAYIHNANYLGGFVGLVIALVHLRRLKLRASQFAK